MPAFEELRAARQARRQPAAAAAATRATSETPKQEDAGSRAMNVNTPLQQAVNDGVGLRDSAACPSTTTLTTTKEESTPVQGLPTYDDFPQDLLEVRQTRSSGRGIYVKRGAKARRGQTLLATAPLTTAISTSQLPHICAHCWLSPYELSVRAGQLGLAAQDTSASASSTGKGKGKEIARREEVENWSFGLKRCTGCRVVRYCSKKCQTLAWKTHAVECKALARFTWLHRSSVPSRSEREEIDELDAVPEEAVRALAGLCWERRRRRQRAGEAGGGGGGGGKDEDQVWEQIRGLQSHTSSLSNRQKEALARLSMALAHFLAAGDLPRVAAGESRTATAEEMKLAPADMREYGFQSIAEVMGLCSAFASNSFTLSSPSLTPIGVAISPLVALFNHSCEPTAVVVFPAGSLANDGKGMVVNALRDLEEGEEVLTAYIDVSLPVKDRQAALTETYHFQCTCQLCRREQLPGTVSSRQAVLHPGCAEAGWANLPDLAALGEAQLVCNKCQQSFSVAVQRLANLIEAGQEILAADASGRLQSEQAQRLPGLVRSLLDLVPPSTHPLFALLRLQALLDSSATPDGLNVVNPNRAIQAAALAWKGMLEVYPSGHPSIGIVLAELGKLLNLDTNEPPASPLGDRQGLVLPNSLLGRRQLALQTMQQSQLELRVGFGGDGGLVAAEMEGLSGGLTRELTMSGASRQISTK